MLLLNILIPCLNIEIIEHIIWQIVVAYKFYDMSCPSMSDFGGNLLKGVFLLDKCMY
jgi:hypothetical protein